MKNKRRPTKHIPPLSEKGIIFLKILDGFGVLLMMITMLACIEIEQMDQIFFGGTFFVIFCIVGSILGIQTVYFIEKRIPYLLIQGQQRTFSLEVYFSSF
jgi:hypothetical protein